MKECPFTSSNVLILYGDWVSEEFNKVYGKAVDYCTKEKVGLVIWPWLPFVEGERMTVLLQGFGAGLAIKNMEYVNDKNRKDTETDEVKGFFFDTLIERCPDVKEKWLEFKADLVEVKNEVDIWDLRNMGQQFITKVNKVSDEKRIETAA